MRTKTLVTLLLLGFSLPVAAQYDDTSAAETAAGIAAMGGCMIFALVALAINIFILVWVYRDAKSRGMDNAVVWLLIVLLTGLIGLIIYLIVRPKGPTAPCHSCGKKRMEGLAVCPHCNNP